MNARRLSNPGRSNAGRHDLVRRRSDRRGPCHSDNIVLAVALIHREALKVGLQSQDCKPADASPTFNREGESTMAEDDHETASGLVAALQAAQTALNAAVADGPEAMQAPGGALYAGSRPTTQAAATMAAAVAALATYVKTFGPERDLPSANRRGEPLPLGGETDYILVADSPLCL
jgi:hypothetical protein